MSDKFGEFSEQTPKSSPKLPSSNLTLEKAIEMGEYNPTFLSTFPEWSSCSKYIQWNYIRQGIKNRRSFLLRNWAETNNVLDFSLKPKMQQVLDNIDKQQQFLNKEEERLRFEYLK